jgi:iron complex outermembrane receptor protein
MGIFDKRVGPMWNDLTLANNQVANQIIPINSFNTTNLYFNYVLRNGTRFDQTKFRFSVNNLLNERGIVGDQQASNAYANQAAAVYLPGQSDQLTLLPGRSISFTMTLGFSLRKQ